MFGILREEERKKESIELEVGCIFFIQFLIPGPTFLRYYP
jgi:hypothetical protein